MPLVVLITGASSGIGKETARLLLKHGYIVYGVARRLAAMEDLQQAGAHILHLDLTDDYSIRQAVGTVLEHEGRIDVLVNSAGFGSTGALEDVPLSEARGQFDVNVFGLVRLTQLVLPAMRSQGSGKIINLSSVGGRVATPLSGWYNATKFSVEALSDALRLEVRPFGIHVVLIEPGGIRTGWTPEAISSAKKNSGQTAYSLMAARLVAGLEAYEPRMPEPGVVAHAIARAIEARKPRARYVMGFMARPALLGKRLLPQRIWDAIVARQFR